jgi:hypothetical protein
MDTISQSVAWWCFVPEKLTAEQFVNAVADAGYKAIELVPPEYWSLVADHGLALSAIAAHHPLTIGLNLKAIKETGHAGFVTHEFVPKGDPIKALKTAFDTCAIFL